MKPLYYLILLSTLFSGSHARELTSADGSQRIVADFISFDAREDRVTLRLASGRQLVAAVSAFSEEDRKYFIARQKSAAMEKAIAVEIKKDTKRDSSNGNGNLKVDSRKLDYHFLLSNSSELDLKNLQFSYWIVVDRDKKGKELETIHRKEKIAKIKGGQKIAIEGPTVSLVQNAVSTCTSNCPKLRASVAAKASAIGKDRVVGTKVLVTDAKGNVLYRHSDSQWVDAMLADKGTDKRKTGSRSSSGSLVDKSLVPSISDRLSDKFE